jgi:hypothetical protein
VSRAQSRVYHSPLYLLCNLSRVSGIYIPSRHRRQRCNFRRFSPSSHTVGPYPATLFIAPQPYPTCPALTPRNLISSKIRSLLISLTNKPSDYDQIAPKIEYWIEYVLRAHFTTVDELVEGVSYVAWEDGGSYASVARFLKEFRDAPHRSEQARSFVTQLCSYVLRWFAIASVESFQWTAMVRWVKLRIRWRERLHPRSIVRWSSHRPRLAEPRARAAASHQATDKPLRRGRVSKKPLWEPPRANAIYQLFIAAGNTLFQGLLEAEDVRICFETIGRPEHGRENSGV